VERRKTNKKKYHLAKWHITVGDLKLRGVILHKKVQEDPFTPLRKPQERS
jgi:hypothetical protein